MEIFAAVARYEAVARDFWFSGDAAHFGSDPFFVPRARSKTLL